MLVKILSSPQIFLVNTLRIRFNMVVSWKKIKQEIFDRERYFKDYEMLSGSLRIDHEKYKIYISTKSPQVVRTSEQTYRVLGNDNNFTFTFLQNLDYMSQGKQFSWSNRKNISMNFRDILEMQTVSRDHPVTIKNQFYSLYNNQESRILKQLKIQVMEDGQTLKLSLMILTESDSQKWIGVYQINWNDYKFMVQSAKKNIYYSSGLKTMIELQKRQIIRLMDKRVVKDQQKSLKSTIQYDIDQKDLLDQMDNSQNVQSKSTKAITKKKTIKKQLL